MVDPTSRSATALTGSATALRRTTTAGLRLGAGLALAAGLTLPMPAVAQKGGGVSITHLGHSALLIQGGGARVLVNPFQAVGCAAGLPVPRVSADVILASSLLKDEGAQVASGKFLVKPGSYRLAGLQIEGIAAPHDRVGGRRFGNATLWRWRQGGLDIAHLGGTAGRLGPADRVLLGRPDVLIIGVGGGGKVYTGQEAAEVARELQARRVIPVQYTTGKPPAGCDQGSVEPFLKAMVGATVRRSGRTISVVPPLGDGVVVEVMR
ncbi:MBL fold metallo-hydrolase [Cyanobium gracile]|uniref:Putative Zn-dependent hydrolase of beta-lactamase fold protein n=1 Tax=Cyanobium gracile (strain ATCC 27147 / PCC 6307) TaxID=292564 RepID=K9PAF4_CYAGP|nr:putative Zn-dependent hydrolase of beta-lactamase fold protein [Cyanobium gracile PCC 6307]